MVNRDWNHILRLAESHRSDNPKLENHSYSHEILKILHKWIPRAGLDVIRFIVIHKACNKNSIRSVRWSTARTALANLKVVGLVRHEQNVKAVETFTLSLWGLMFALVDYEMSHISRSSLPRWHRLHDPERPSYPISKNLEDLRTYFTALLANFSEVLPKTHKLYSVLSTDTEEINIQLDTLSVPLVGIEMELAKDPQEIDLAICKNIVRGFALTAIAYEQDYNPQILARKLNEWNIKDLFLQRLDEQIRAYEFQAERIRKIKDRIV